MIVSQHTFLHLLRAYYGLSKYNFQFVCLLFPYCFNAVEAQVELFYLFIYLLLLFFNKGYFLKLIN